MTKRLLTIGAALLLLGACGGSGSEGGQSGALSESSGGEGAHHEGHEAGEGGGHHHAMNADLRTFHDVLAPVYHLEPGGERAEAACAASGRMVELSGGVDAAAAEDLEEGSAEAEAHETTAAHDSTAHLAELCGASPIDVAAVEQALESVHTAFHHAMEEWGEHHSEDHGEHHGEHHESE